MLISQPIFIEETGHFKISNQQNNEMMTQAQTNMARLNQINIQYSVELENKEFEVFDD